MTSASLRRSAQSRAAALSRKLRAAGFSPTSPSDYNRQGLKVRPAEGLTVARVVVDVDARADRHRLGDDAAAACRELGYLVDVRVSEDSYSFTVTAPTAS